MEIFKDIPGYPGLKASSFGRIIGIKGEEVGCHKNKYVICGGRMEDDPKKKWTQSRARLILRAFVGPPPSDKPEVEHINMNKHDDRPENLKWADRYEQMQNRNVLAHSSSKIKGLHLLKNTISTQADRWRCTINVKHIAYVKHFRIDKKQEAIEWLVAKRIELGI